MNQNNIMHYRNKIAKEQDRWEYIEYKFMVISNIKTHLNQWIDGMEYMYVRYTWI